MRIRKARWLAAGVPTLAGFVTLTAVAAAQQQNHAPEIQCGRLPRRKTLPS